jgi:SAM-dependent methyltransferase
LLCQACDQRFPKQQYAVADFAATASFDDWWMKDEQTRRHWLEQDAVKEEEYEIGLARNYVLPLLRQLQLQPQQTAILSAGCGLASDVEFLNEQGYDSWGIDIGNRVLGWSRRTCRQRLARADLRDMPFRDAAFDFVLSLNTIEHVGVVGDTTRVTADYWEQRLRAMRSLLRVTKPGGYLLLSGLSRTIPFDVGHVQEVRWVRIHSPWEKFLLNYRDVRQLCAQAGGVESTRPLPLRGFFSWTRLRHNRCTRPFLPLVDWLFGCLPHAAYGSWLSPFWIVLVRRSQ